MRNEDNTGEADLVQDDDSADVPAPQLSEDDIVEEDLPVLGDADFPPAPTPEDD